MNIITEAKETKKHIADALELWATGLVDDFAKGTPKMTMAGVYLKNGIKNYRKISEEKWDKMLDDVAMFVADEQGNINLHTLFRDAMQFLDDADETPISLGIFNGTIGKGAIKIHVPNNVLMRLIFNDSSAVVIKKDDIIALKALLEQK